MKKISIIAGVVIAISLTACAKKEDPNVEANRSIVQNLPKSNDVAETPISVIRRYVDEEYGNVCYVYIESINCVPLKKKE